MMRLLGLSFKKKILMISIFAVTIWLSLFLITSKNDDPVTAGRRVDHSAEASADLIYANRSKTYDEMFEKRDFDKLLRLLVASENEFEHVPSYWNLKGSTEVGLMKYSESKRDFEKAIALSIGDDSVSKFNLAQAHIATKDFQKAMEVLRSILDAPISPSVDRQMTVFSYCVCSLADTNERGSSPIIFSNELDGRWRDYFNIAIKLSDRDTHAVGVKNLNERGNGNIDAVCYDILKSCGLYP